MVREGESTGDFWRLIFFPRSTRVRLVMKKQNANQQPILEDFKETEMISTTTGIPRPNSLYQILQAKKTLLPQVSRSKLEDLGEELQDSESESDNDFYGPRSSRTTINSGSRRSISAKSKSSSERKLSSAFSRQHSVEAIPINSFFPRDSGESEEAFPHNRGIFPRSTAKEDVIDLFGNILTEIGDLMGGMKGPDLGKQKEKERGLENKAKN